MHLIRDSESFVTHSHLCDIISVYILCNFALLRPLFFVRVRMFASSILGSATHQYPYTHSCGEGGEEVSVCVCTFVCVCVCVCVCVYVCRAHLKCAHLELTTHYYVYIYICIYTCIYLCL